MNTQNNIFKNIKLDNDIRDGIYPNTKIHEYHYVASRLIRHSNNPYETDTYTKPYIAVTLNIDGTLINTRIYESCVRYCMYQLRRQLDMQFVPNLEIDDILMAAMNNPFTVTVTHSVKYGLNIDYIAKEVT